MLIMSRPLEIYLPAITICLFVITSIYFYDWVERTEGYNFNYVGYVIKSIYFTLLVAFNLVAILGVLRLLIFIVGLFR